MLLTNTLRRAADRIVKAVAVPPPPMPAETAPEEAASPPEPPYQGYIDECSRFHVAGWVRNLADPDERPVVEVLVRRGAEERVAGHATADEFSEPLFRLQVGDGHHAFFLLFDRPLPAEDADGVVVRVAGRRHEVERAPAMRRDFTPISHVALDLVNNCNLRCPFCVYDYTDVRTTRRMTEATFRNALTLLPFVTDGNFWLSCLHEPTLHPELTRFIGLVPAEYRRKLFFTTNLAKRQPEEFFAFLAASGMHHINISVESFDPAIYEKMRKGARHAIFRENLERLKNAFANATSPPKLRFISLVFRSNLAEIPELVAFTRAEYGAWQNEVRTVFDKDFIDPAFKAEEYLRDEDQPALRRMVATLPADGLVLDLPPDTAAAPATAASAAPARPPRFVPRPLNLRVEWDGTLIVCGPRIDDAPDGPANTIHEYVVTNIDNLRNPLKFLLNI